MTGHRAGGAKRVTQQLINHMSTVSGLGWLVFGANYVEFLSCSMTTVQPSVSIRHTLHTL